jgi:protein gp37
MNRTKIEWTTFTWNPITSCDYGCWYCNTMRMSKRFPKRFPNGLKPTFWPERLKEPWECRKPSKIFACSISDIFADWTHPDWRDQVLLSIFGCPVKHIFQLLTKQPQNIPIYMKFPDNVWIGCTVTNEFLDETSRNLTFIKMINARIRFASFEPLLGPLPTNISLKGLQWIIIGKLTGSRRVQLKPEWVWRIVREAQELGIPVFMKNNLAPVIPKEQILQEWPN